MTYQNLLLEEREPGILLLTINRPAALNALNRATLEELARAVRELRDQRGGRVLLVTGSGDKAFVAGADIREMLSLTPVEAMWLAETGIEVFRGLERLPIPTVALVNGFALGGGSELAMSCDMILASDRAVFGQPEINIGIMPGFGGTQRLLRLVGRARALELTLTGRQVKAIEAKEIGLVNHVYPVSELMDRGMELARLLASKPPLPMKLAKQMVQHGLDMNLAGATLWSSIPPLSLDGEIVHSAPSGPAPTGTRAQARCCTILKCSVASTAADLTASERGDRDGTARPRSAGNAGVARSARRRAASGRSRARSLPAGAAN